MKFSFEIGIIDAETAINELKKREIFQTEVEAGDYLTKGNDLVEDPFGGQGGV